MNGDVAALLRDLAVRGVQVGVVGDVLEVSAPKGVVTPETLETLKAHKAELLALLALPQGLPEIAVTAAIAYCDARGITDLIIRKVNVLLWVMSHLVYREGAEGENYKRVKAKYHAFVHTAFPLEPCELCAWEKELAPSPDDAPQTVAEAEAARAAWTARNDVPGGFYCPACQGTRFWERPENSERVCQTCHPDPREVGDATRR